MNRRIDFAPDNSVSVVIPCHNAERYLAETLRSVLDQTIAPFEVLVIDDGSTDESPAIAERYGDPVRLVRQPQAGPSRARNHGFELARGDWVAFLDADDLWEPTKLVRQLEACGRCPGVLCCHTWYRFLFADRLEPADPIGPLITHDYRVSNLLRYHMINTSTALVRRDVPLRFPEWLRHGEDLIFFAQFAALAHDPFVFVPDPLVRYRQYGTRLSEATDDIVENRRGCFRWLAENRATLGPSVVDEARSALVEDLLERLQNLKWKRDWPRYWALRRFLSTLPELTAGHPLLREHIFSPVLYALKDAAERWLQGRRRSNEQSTMP